MPQIFMIYSMKEKEEQLELSESSGMYIIGFTIIL
jgi:hypothetical protein